MRRDNGFTLIEIMIVVMLLMAVIIGVPSIHAWLERQGVRLAADQLRADLQLARLMAIHGRRTCSIVLNRPGHNQYLNSLNQQSVDLAHYRGGVHFMRSGPDGGALSERLNFSRRGMSVPAGTIYLADRERSRIYRIRVLAAGGISVLRWTGSQWR